MALKGKKKSKKVEKKFDLEEKELKEKDSNDIDEPSEDAFSSMLPDNKTLSKDIDEDESSYASGIILQTYVQGKRPKKPMSVDKLVLNSISLVESGYQLIPWIEGRNNSDPYIDECIKNSSSGDIGDLMDSSDVLNLQDDFIDSEDDLNKEDDGSDSLEVI